MTKEKMLQAINKALEIAKKEYIYGISTELDHVKEALESEIMVANAKTSGKDKEKKLLDAIIKRAMKKNNKVLHGSWMYNNMTCVVDGWTLAAINGTIETVKIPDDCKPFDIGKMIEISTDTMTAHTVPIVSALKSEIKIAKASAGHTKYKRVVFCFGENMPTVNAEFLVDFVNCFGNKCFYTDKKQPIYFQNEIGTGLILPIKSELKERGFYLI